MLSLLLRRMLLHAVEPHIEGFSHPCSMLAYLVGCVAEKRAEVMVASHNQTSVESCLELMHDLGIPNTQGAPSCCAEDSSVQCHTVPWLSGCGMEQPVYNITSCIISRVPVVADSGLYFAQVLGMADHLTYPLGHGGYNVYKLVTYGPVEETIAWLLRRLHENSNAMGGCAHEVAMLRSELMRRLGLRQKRS